jgi:site-specific recombinase XerD
MSIAPKTTSLASCANRQQLLKRVASNLYRSDVTDIYYAIFKAGGKQYHHSLHTTDRALAERRLADKRRGVARLSTTDGKKLPFGEYNDRGNLIGGLAKQWIDVVGTAIEASTRDRYLQNVAQLVRAFAGLSVGRIGLKHVERWSMARVDCSANTFNKELDVLRRVMNFAVDHGLRLDNPARMIKRRHGHQKPIVIPTQEQFSKLLSVMRANDGEESADLAELLACSGCRKSEIVGDKKYGKQPMRWRDIEFDLKTFTVAKSKNHEPRTVPLFPAMENFLRGLRAKLPEPPKPEHRIIPIDSARTALERACQKIGLAQYGHHTFRHFFSSNAIERGVDFKTIASWFGHRDGGVLCAKTYGHLRNEHSARMALRMDWSAGEGSPPDNIVPFPRTATK